MGVCGSTGNVPPPEKTDYSEAQEINKSNNSHNTSSSHIIKRNSVNNNTSLSVETSKIQPRDSTVEHVIIGELNSTKERPEVFLRKHDQRSRKRFSNFS